MPAAVTLGVRGFSSAYSAHKGMKEADVDPALWETAAFDAEAYQAFVATRFKGRDWESLKRRLPLDPPAPVADPEADKLGAALTAVVARQDGLVRNPPVEAYLSQVATLVAESSHAYDLPVRVYVLDSASLGMTSNGAKFTCNECTIVLTTSGTDMSKIGDVDLTGGKLTMTPPKTGTYKGLILYQDRRATLDNDVKVNGNSTSKLEGALYFPRADLTFNGTTGMNTNCLQIVSWIVKFTGNSAVSNTCPAGSGAAAFVGKKIRLVE